MKKISLIESIMTIIVTTQENIGELLIVFVICKLTPKEIPIVFHDGSTYDYHFIIKEVAKEFKV